MLSTKLLGVGFAHGLVMMEPDQNLESKLGSPVLVFSMCWFYSAYADRRGKITIPVSLALQLS